LRIHQLRKTLFIDGETILIGMSHNKHVKIIFSQLEFPLFVTSAMEIALVLKMKMNWQHIKGLG
jgi:hypothetical protein